MAFSVHFSTCSVYLRFTLTKNNSHINCELVYKMRRHHLINYIVRWVAFTMSLCKKWVIRGFTLFLIEWAAMAIFFKEKSGFFEHFCRSDLRLIRSLSTVLHRLYEITAAIIFFHILSINSIYVFQIKCSLYKWTTKHTVSFNVLRA